MKLWHVVAALAVYELWLKRKPSAVSFTPNWNQPTPSTPSTDVATDGNGVPYYLAPNA